MQLFASARRPGQCAKRRKRKRDTDADNQELEADDLPPPPFPHAPAAPPKKENAPQQLAHLRLYPARAPAASSEASALRRTHHNVLFTILHRCLLQGDYRRAGRSWGLILRTQIAGKAIDVRNHGRWAIGAEVLLTRAWPQRAHHDVQSPRREQHPPQLDLYSEHGFELAKEYYERLIIQYPHRRSWPNTVDATTFYPAMFSLWIYEIQERSWRARQGSVADDAASLDSDQSPAPDDDPVREEAIVADELAQALEVADRLEQLTASPPLDKRVDLLQIRGNISLWISDLTMRKSPSMIHSDSDMDDDDARGQQSPADMWERISRSIVEMEKAQEYFDRAANNGGHVPKETIYTMDLRVRELTKRRDNYQRNFQSLSAT